MNIEEAIKILKIENPFTQFVQTPQGLECFGLVTVPLALVQDGRIKVKFWKVHGSFKCDNLRLTTLENSPLYVFGSFFCECNKLTSLLHCPKYVENHFWCWDNPLYNYNHLQIVKIIDNVFLPNPSLKDMIFYNFSNAKLSHLGEIIQLYNSMRIR